jgi:hypothetical protein
MEQIKGSLKTRRKQLAYEHVEKQDGDEDLKENKDDLRHVGIWTFAQLLVLDHQRHFILCFILYILPVKLLK